MGSNCLADTHCILVDVDVLHQDRSPWSGGPSRLHSLQQSEHRSAEGGAGAGMIGRAFHHTIRLSPSGKAAT